ncbi:hypothetical protein TMatcc_005971 [Talaromyces marneffei ATCC 18224]|uniref:Large ribosomal subunit protein mL50 n=2 Tax=Talaromyces marneffei TaxID=37727 RepID=B6Q8J0_TALMQ|nr:uncharacterized protein EYB26_005534 [Talaromyces marneffei]EEA25794.1 conserved hypothetical protein [Talaromyces marneffei ATCC 18224]KAE8554491.1 hypothetical protein EYB25_003030 [Talaromyces marneffei]QGA17858.1 hypothetical protein EYB26_005534 [Talaromyces marneffei]
MRPPVRLLKPLEAPSLRSSKNALYVCSNCRYDASLPSSSQHQSRRYASGSGNTPFTDKIRRRIWGTDNPPGLEDPYGGEGVIAKEWAKRKAQYMGEDKREAQQNDGKEQVPEEEEDHEYDEGEGLLPADFTPATTAHDLPRMGHLSQWNDFPPSQADIYQGFLSLKKANRSAHFRSAAQSVAVELSLLHELKKPLSLACDLTRHDQMIWKMIRECQIKDGNLKFPNEKTKETLFFVFNQLGETPEVQTETTAEATEAAVDVTEQLEAEAVADEEFEVEEVAEVEEPQGIVDAVHSFALKHTKAPKDEGYLQFSLADPAIKFAFFKRYSQITGHHMQDICAYNAKSIGDVIAHVEKIYCRPQKLAKELRTLKGRLDIPNLAIYSKRYTKAQHDREVGRAKLVEAALRERGLLKEQSESKFRL